MPGVLLRFPVRLVGRPYGDVVCALKHYERHLVKQLARAGRRRCAAELLVFARTAQILLDALARRQSVKAVHESAPYRRHLSTDLGRRVYDPYPYEYGPR